jgi:hypothetical protein
MRHKLNASQVPGLAAGILAGLAIAYLWPYEPAYATTGDRAAHFSMVTVPVADATNGIIDPLDGVFVLDLVTGQLKGAVMNRQFGKLASFYFRDLARDFALPPNQVPEFCMVTGYAQLANQGAAPMASGVIYIGEHNSGKVMGYCLAWQEKGGAGPVPLIPVDTFQWKQPGS